MKFHLVAGLLNRPAISTFPCGLDSHTPASRGANHAMTRHKLHMNFVIGRLGPYRSFGSIIGRFENVTLAGRTLARYTKESEHDIRRSRYNFPTYIGVV